MGKGRRIRLAVAVAAALAILFASPCFSQDKPDDAMQILSDRMKAGKKLLVAENMGLTESEAKGFWPVYEAYQRELGAINERIGRLIEDYARDFTANTLTDVKAGRLIDEMLAVSEAEQHLNKTFVPRLKKVLPARKVIRYLQIENKIRAVLKFEIAKGVPLAE